MKYEEKSEFWGMVLTHLKRPPPFPNQNFMRTTTQLIGVELLALAGDVTKSTAAKKNSYLIHSFIPQMSYSYTRKL